MKRSIQIPILIVSSFLLLNLNWQLCRGADISIQADSSKSEQSATGQSPVGKWQETVKAVWQAVMTARAKKYLQIEQGNAPNDEINKLDRELQQLEAGLDNLINEGIKNRYASVQVRETQPKLEIVLPGISKGEPVVGGVAGGAANKGSQPAAPATGGVYRGRAIFQVHPAYPAGADGAVGDVSVEVTISKEGRVVSARCSVGHPALQKSALSAASQWRFLPTLLDSQPVSVAGVLTFRFTK